jgi:multiple sugar transport system ATP-binding protein
MSAVTLRGVQKSYGTARVIHGVDLSVQQGEFCVFVGPSGCGKSTLLRMIAGLEDITAGEIGIGGQRVNEVEAVDRGVAMVFQNYALYPHMTVAENMGFALRMARMPREEIRRRVLRAAGILQIEPLLSRKPRDLSGGQRQRVAIGRAIVREPKVFLFDEPLSNLDAALRVQMRIEIAKLHSQLRATMIYVTHDQTEAMTLADRIVILNNGRVEQAGSPLDLYHQPSNAFVAGFIGSPAMNFLKVDVVASHDGPAIKLPGGTETKLPTLRSLPSSGAITLGIRPEHLSLVQEGPGITATASVVEQLGSDAFVYAVAADQTAVTIRVSGASRVRPGDAIRIAFDPRQAHVFDASGRSLGLA